MTALHSQAGLTAFSKTGVCALTVVRTDGVVHCRSSRSECSPGPRALVMSQRMIDPNAAQFRPEDKL